MIRLFYALAVAMVPIAVAGFATSTCNPDAVMGMFFVGICVGGVLFSAMHDKVRHGHGKETGRYPDTASRHDWRGV